MRAASRQMFTLRPHPWAWCLATLLAAGQIDAATAPAPQPTKRTLSFTLENDSVNGTIQFGTELVLGVTLNGGAPLTDPLVAVLEGSAIDKVMVPMEATDQPSQWRASVAVKPHPLGYTSVRPKALRVRVTVSLVKPGNQLQRIIGRSAYLTMAHEQPEPPTGETETAPAEVELVAATISASGDEVQPDVAPVANALIAEEDLKPLPETKGQQGYWKEVTRLISRSWGQRVRYAKGVQGARETVRVAFRMHPNGEAQLIQVERSSGVRDVDEAGLLAIVQAHPFPPFPGNLAEGAVDVHVRMRTGAKPTAVAQQAPATPAPASIEVQPAAPASSKPAAESKTTQ